ncbi:(2Fe-2S)-binding protein [Neobacillus pocheonensis]|uniref:(2Fe-2S)-binding protein n=1 Tax=Neobacillus pocheonensis TaxID=363869 RepID=A0ABT0WIN4_9BACI|nr:(2Fe-2S)-binding protein [Neobacillus pocheonensis]
MCNHSFIICRCEEVTINDIQDAIAAGALNSHEMKMSTRAGMGMCQGRLCRPLLEALMPANHKESVHSPSKLTFHQPVRPVSLAKIVPKENSI